MGQKDPKYCFHGDVEEIGFEPDGSTIYHCLWCNDTWNSEED